MARILGLELRKKGETEEDYLEVISIVRTAEIPGADEVTQSGEDSVGEAMAQDRTL